MEDKIFESNQNDNEISLKELILKFFDWWNYLLSKWIFIICFGIFGGIFGFFYAKSKTATYTAVTTFVLAEGDQGGGLGQYAGLASMIGIDAGGGGGIFQGDNIMELYKSRTMIEQTLLTKVEYEGKQQVLLNCYITFNKLKERWSKNPSLKNINFDNSTTKFSRVQDSIMGTIVSDINISYLNVSKPDKKISIIKAEVKAPDEFFAKTFNEQIVKNVNDFYTATKTKKSLENVLILQQKTDSIRSMMTGALYKAAAVSDATPNLNPTHESQRTVPMQRSQFSVEVNKAMLSELLKNLELSKITLRKEAPLIQIVDKPIYPLAKTKFGKLRGILTGGILLGFMATFFLLFKRLLKSILT